MRVSEIMTKSVKSCSVNDTLQRAAQLMWENDCGCVPVTDVDGSVVGILTDRDVCMAGYTQGKPFAEIPVSIAMARSVHTVSEDDPVESAEALMRDKQVRRVPVLDGGNRLRGILSLNDLARQTQRAHGRRSNGIGADAIAQTLAAIGEPHAEHQHARA